MAGKLDGKVAVITGANSGIGLATAERFIAEGAFVFITGRRQAELDEAQQRLGAQARAVQGDVANLADLDRLYATVQREQGRIDILFANAGVAPMATIDAVTEEHYNAIFDINVRGLLFSVQKALPLLRDGGSIILNASIVASRGMPAFSVYSASKAAVRSFARTWSTDLKARKIRVNAVSPGFIPTPGYKTLGLSDEQLERTVAAGTADIPAGRPGTPDEIAKAVVFLAADDSSYISGIELTVDGGLTQV